jgi:hypothetical protein
LIFLFYFFILNFLEPHIVVHSRRDFTSVSEQPAHIGWRNDKKVVTSLNKGTGKVEQHQINDRYPIYGTVHRVF